MVISFSETFDKVRECFKEPTVVSQLIPKLQSITIIRDVAGKVRLFLESLPGETLQASDITDLDPFLTQKLSSYYGEDIWLQTGKQDGYKALIEIIQRERVRAPWDDIAPPNW